MIRKIIKESVEQYFDDNSNQLQIGYPQFNYTKKQFKERIKQYLSDVIDNVDESQKMFDKIFFQNKVIYIFYKPLIDQFSWGVGDFSFSVINYYTHYIK